MSRKEILTLSVMVGLVILLAVLIWKGWPLPIIEPTPTIPLPPYPTETFTETPIITEIPQITPTQSANPTSTANVTPIPSATATPEPAVPTSTPPWGDRCAWQRPDRWIWYCWEDRTYQTCYPLFCADRKANSVL